MQRSLSKSNVISRGSAALVRDRVKPQTTNWPAQTLLFAKNFLKQPARIGWFLPSSPFVVEEVLKQIDWERARVIVEYGPGLGAFTKGILERMHPDARVVALELNKEFYSYLRKTLSDPRLFLLHESATEVAAVLEQLGLASADYVISGIPFKTLPDELRGELVRTTHSVLKPDGKFLVYQLSGSVRPHLKRVFSEVREDFELLSLPPNRLFYCAR